MGQQVIEVQQTALQVHQPEIGSILNTIERIALDPQADISKLEKLLEMQERVLDRNAKQAFTAAFAEMQSELPEIDRTGQIKYEKNGETITKGKFAKFEDINAEIKPILQKHGFGISFRLSTGDKIKVTGILSHREGHSEETEMELAADPSGNKNASQAVGSAVSYGKRYVLCALLNISTRGEDDDARSAEARVTPFQERMVRNLLVKCSQATEQWFAKTYGDPSDVFRSQFPTVIAQLETAIKNAESKATK